MSKRSYDYASSPVEGSSRDQYSRSSEPGLPSDHIAKAMVIEDSGPQESTMMQCSLPPHANTLHFASVDTFEVHYLKEHTNRCVSCGNNLPSAHFLALHLDEVHNPVREALAAKGEKTYGCFVEDCDKKCSNPTKRRLHLIDKHGFPKSYNFRVVQTGLDQTTSLLREGRKRRVSIAMDPPSRHHRRISHTDIPAHDGDLSTTSRSDHAVQHEKSAARGAQPQALSSLTNDVKNSGPGDHMDDLETALSALTFVPRSVLSRQTRR